MIRKEWPVLLAHHLEWLRVHNYSDLTVQQRLHYLNRFIKWAAERGIVRPSEVTKPILERIPALAVSLP